ncbi:ribonuclease HI [Stappia stellulata]|uniref:ribonuclease HI n=1 Tax=Stappia stellulata TaxID=71235 RepID=UPI00055F7120|nr:ribonuclease HI [Stappia stellulata]
MVEDTRPVTIYTDGACSGNPGPGGWAAILTGRRTPKLLSGGEPHTTNNRMELAGALEGLKALSRPSQVTMISDSQYVVKGASIWWPEWRDRGWKGIKNRDLWEELLDVCPRHVVRWEWVSRHSGDPLNERADRLAREALRRQTRLLQTIARQGVSA